MSRELTVREQRTQSLSVAGGLQAHHNRQMSPRRWMVLAIVAVALPCTAVRVARIAGGATTGGSSQAPLDMWHSLLAATKQPGSTFIIPPGVYDFGKTRLILRGVQDFDIVATGVEFLFDKGVSYDAGGVLLEKCNNVKIDGLTIDYKATTAQGVLAYWLDNQSFVATLDIGNFRNPLEDPWFTEESPTVKVMFVTEASSSHKMLRHPTRMGAVNVFANKSGYRLYKRINDTHINVQVTTNGYIPPQLGVTIPQDFPKRLGDMPRGGTPLAIIPRGGHHAFTLAGSAGIVVNGLRIYASPNFGINEKMSDGPANEFTDLFIGIRPLPGTNIPRYIATNADGFHSNGNALGPRISRSVISYTGDDHVNIYCFEYIVTSANPGAGTITVLDHGSSLFNRLSRLLAEGGPQTLSFYALRDERHTLQGEAVVVKRATKVAQGTAEYSKAMNSRQTLMAEGEKFLSAAFKNPVPIECAVELPTDSPVWAALGDGLRTLAVHDQAKNKNAVVEGNTFRESYARSSMIKASGAQFLNNAYDSGGGIFIESRKEWLEGDPGLENIAFKDNSCQNVRISIGPEAKNVQLENNQNCQ